MKTLVIILFALVAATGSGFAQNLIAVQNGGEPKFYQQVDDAIGNSQDGDTIYIPGGSWYINSPINKRLHIFGVGHHPKETLATARTILNLVSLNSGASGGTISGCYLNNGMNINETMSSFTIYRCFIPGILSEVKSGVARNFSLIENTFGSVTLNGTGNYICNNIFTGRAGFSESIIKNNNFLYYNDFSGALSANDCQIHNNIFYDNRSNFIRCILYNNINDGVNGIDSHGNQGSGNYLDAVSQQSLFVNYDRLIHSGQDIYNADFHLTSDSPYKNAGTDGTGIGIYGGIYPWKEGSIPFNPHFQQVQVSPKTDANGNLNVNIKVAAQER